ncbi:hypothetical protein BpHYR1_005893 [Brachionus plicatilis]|uniref:Uncharacterized protein n=1 Tax=Brachionus plicatilis TaxID=10195 RepID=A0A3M7QMH1_BRAPC|nr:hypothetical protein BpHYR1_005893 [Brachionus plicatilis]
MSSKHLGQYIHKKRDTKFCFIHDSLVKPNVIPTNLISGARANAFRLRSDLSAFICSSPRFKKCPSDTHSAFSSPIALEVLGVGLFELSSIKKSTLLSAYTLSFFLLLLILTPLLVE